MSVGHGWRLGKDRRHSGRRAAHPSAWQVWTVPRPFLVYVLAVDAAAVLLVALTANLVPVSGRDVTWFAMLAVAAILHLEITRGVERLRELHTEGRAYTNLMSIWTVAGLLVLPPVLVAGLLVLTYVHMWLRLGRRSASHRWVFSACNVIVASAAGGAILVAASPQSYPVLPHGPTGFAVIVAATLTRWMVNRTVASFALILMQPRRTTVKQAFRPSAGDLIESGALVLGVLAAYIIDENPIVLLAVAAAALVMHYGLTQLQFQASPRRDSVTGLHTAGFWHETAGKALQRASSEHTTVGVLLIHVDNFAALTAHRGLTAGDHVLRRVADIVRATVRKHDLVGRLPGEDFAVLMPEITTADLAGVAERIRLAIRGLTVQIDGPDNAPATIDGLTASIGGALYPDHATDVKALLLRADGSVIAAQYGHDGDEFRFARHTEQRRPAR